MTNSIKDTLTAIADAIRKRTGKTEKMKVADMPAEIASIPAGTTGGKDKEIVEGTITDYKNDEVTKVRDGAFNNLTTLTSVDLPAVTSIGRNAFVGCNGLKTVNFPSATSIGESAFASSGLTAIDLPAVTSIRSGAFISCNGLKTVNFPSATSIGYDAFGACSKLTSLKVGTNSSKICTLSDSDVFNMTPIASGTGFIYVPDALVDEYKKATNWAAFANQIKPLSEAPTT